MSDIDLSIFIFAGEGSQLAKYRARDLAYGGRILDLGIDDIVRMIPDDDQHFYILSHYAIQHRLFRDLSLVNTFEPEDGFKFLRMAIDNNYIYITQWSESDDFSRLAKYRKQDFSLLAYKDFTNGALDDIVVDDANIYVIFHSHTVPASYIKIIDKGTLETKLTDAGSGWSYDVLWVDESYLYAATTSSVTWESDLIVFNKSDLSELFRERWSDVLYDIISDADYFYIVGEGELTLSRVIKYSKVDFSQVATGPGWERWGLQMLFLDDYLYVIYVDVTAEGEEVKIKKHKREDLSVVKSVTLPSDFPSGYPHIVAGKYGGLQAYIINTP